MSPKSKTVAVLRWILPVVVIAAAAVAVEAMVAARRLPEAGEQRAEPPVVRTIRATREPVTLHVQSYGTVQPKTTSTLVAQVGGRIEAVAPELAEGSFFEKSTLLLQIEKADYEAAIKQADAAVETAKRALAFERSEAKLAIEEWKQRMGDVKPDPIAAHVPQLDEAKAALAAAEAARDRAGRNLQRTAIRAPFAGRVRQKLVDRGQVVLPGTPLARIDATDRAEITLPVPDRDLAFFDLRLDPPVTLRARYAGSDRRWNGRIVRVDSEIDPKTRMVRLIAEVDDPYARKDDSGHSPMPVGLFVAASIEGRRMAGVFALPRHAMRGRDTVYVVDQELRLRARRVHIVKAEGKSIIVDSGLKSGEQVCVSVIDSFIEGTRVRVEAER